MTLQEAYGLDGRLFDRVQRLDATSALGALSDLQVPTLMPEDGRRLSADEVQDMATLHGYAALQVGFDPEDPCLHWFQAELIEEFLPTPQALLLFEDRLLRRVGRALVQGGRQRAMDALERLLGPVSLHERRDWSALPIGRLRDMQGTQTEDDRALMVARLEELALRATDALDVRAALSILRQIAAVQGLTFQDQDKKQKELLLLLSATPQIRSEALALVEPPKEDR